MSERSKPTRDDVALEGSAPTAAWRARNLAAGLGLWVIAAAVYLPATRCDYIWDDDDYVLNNPTLRSIDGLGRIWFEIGATPQYYPLVHTSYWLEYHLWGLEPAGYHLVNLCLHALAAVLLWRVLLLLGVPGAWWAAAIFALHPVHVESVAWITERKNVLSGVFYLGAALAYLRYAQSPSLGRYVPVFVAMACGLMSKKAMVTFPCVLLLLEYCPLQQLFSQEWH